MVGGESGGVRCDGTPSFGRLPKRAESSQSPLHWKVLHLGQRAVRLSADLARVRLRLRLRLRVRVKVRSRAKIRDRDRDRERGLGRGRVRVVECRPA